MLAVNHFLRKCLCDDIFCRWFSKNIICFPFFKHFVSSNNHIFKTVDGQWTIPLRKLFSCIFLVHFFFGTMLDRILELPLRKVQTKKSFNSILVTKLFLFHSQRLCSRQVLFFMHKKKQPRDATNGTIYYHQDPFFCIFFLFKNWRSFPHNWMFSKNELDVLVSLSIYKQTKRKKKQHKSCAGHSCQFDKTLKSFIRV